MPKVAEVARIWMDAANKRDLSVMLELADPDIEFVDSRGSFRGHEELRSWVDRQSYGVVPQFEIQHVFARGDVAVVVSRVELRFLETGEVGETHDGAVAEFRIRDGRVVLLAPRDETLDEVLGSTGLTVSDEVFAD